MHGIHNIFSILHSVHSNSESCSSFSFSANNQLHKMMHSGTNKGQKSDFCRRRPSFMKLRRHSTLQQKKSGGVMEDESRAGFNPFKYPEFSYLGMEVNHCSFKIRDCMPNHRDSSAFFNPMSDCVSSMSDLKFKNTAEIGVSTDSNLGIKDRRQDNKLFVFGQNSVGNTDSFNGLTGSRINLEKPVADKVDYAARIVDSLKQCEFVFGECHRSFEPSKNNYVKKKKKMDKLFHRNFRNHCEVNYPNLKINPNSQRCSSEESNDSVCSFPATLNNCDGGGSHNNLNGRTANIFMLSDEMTKLNLSVFQNKKSAYKDEFCNSNACVNLPFKAENEVASPRVSKSGFSFSKGERFSFGYNERRNPLEHFNLGEHPVSEFCKSKQNSSDLKNNKSRCHEAGGPPIFIFHAKNDICISDILCDTVDINSRLRTHNHSAQVSSMYPISQKASMMNFDCSDTLNPRYRYRKAGVNMRSRFVNDKTSKKEPRNLRKEFRTEQSHGSDFVSPESRSRMNTTTIHHDCLSPMDFSPHGENSSQEKHSDNNCEPLNHMKNTDDCSFNEPCDVNGKIDFGYRFSPEREACNNRDISASTSNLVNDPLLKNFTFTSSSSGKLRKKHQSEEDKSTRTDAAFASAHSCTQSSSASKISSQFVDVKGNDHSFTKNSEDKSKSSPQLVEDSNTSLTMLEKTCQKMKLRGNQAYKDGRFLKAENYYTSVVNLVPFDARKTYFSEVIVLCYNNRAAVRMSLGRIREALEDCLFAIELDSSFHKAHIRAANCCLLLGEVQEATQHYNKCIESGSVVCLDRRIVLEAYDGVKNAEKVDRCREHCLNLLEKRTLDSASVVIGKIDDALSISPHSETLIELKGAALYILQKYEEAIHLCKETKTSAEKNFPSSTSSWRFHLEAISLFHLGKLDAALEFLDNNIRGTYFLKECWKGTLDSGPQFAGVLRKLLQQKNAGNKSFQSGKYSQAVEHYTAALSENVDSRPFVAVCFCNRAAAYKALGEITNAIADCSIAIALDGTYKKAISRRATLYDMIGEYNRAEGDLSKLIDVLELQQSEVKNKSGGPPGKFSDKGTELGVARSRLSVIADKAKKGLSMNLYIILGVKKSDSAAEVRKAYRKAALRHHPDKAGQLLTKSAGGGDGEAWKNIFEVIHKDADLLFKIIGEAYSVLSDRHKKEEDGGTTTTYDHYYNNTDHHSQKGNYSHFRRCPENQKWNRHNNI